MSVKLSKSESKYSDQTGSELTNTTHTLEPKQESPIALAEVSEIMSQHPDMKKEIWEFFTKFCEREQIATIELQKKDQNDYVNFINLKLHNERLKINWAGSLSLFFLLCTGYSLFLGNAVSAGLAGLGSVASIVYAFLNYSKNREPKANQQTEK